MDRQNYAHRAKGGGDPDTAHRQIYGAAVVRPENSYAHACHAMAAVRKFLAHMKDNADAMTKKIYAV